MIHTIKKEFDGNDPSRTVTERTSPEIDVLQVLAGPDGKGVAIITMPNLTLGTAAPIMAISLETLQRCYEPRPHKGIVLAPTPPLHIS